MTICVFNSFLSNLKSATFPTLLMKKARKAIDIAIIITIIITFPRKLLANVNHTIDNIRYIVNSRAITVR